MKVGDFVTSATYGDGEVVYQVSNTVVVVQFDNVKRRMHLSELTSFEEEDDGIGELDDGVADYG